MRDPHEPEGELLDAQRARELPAVLLPAQVLDVPAATDLIDDFLWCLIVFARVF